MKLILTFIATLALAPLAAFAEVKAAPESNGLAPEVPGLNLKEMSPVDSKCTTRGRFKVYEAVVADDDDDGVVTEIEFIECIQHLVELCVGETHCGIVTMTDLELGLLLERAVGSWLAEDFVIGVKGDLGCVARACGRLDGRDIPAAVHIPEALRHLVRRVWFEDAL